MLSFIALASLVACVVFVALAVKVIRSLAGADKSGSGQALVKMLAVVGIFTVIGFFGLTMLGSGMTVTRSQQHLATSPLIDVERSSINGEGEELTITTSAGADQIHFETAADGSRQVHLHIGAEKEAERPSDQTASAKEAKAEQADLVANEDGEMLVVPLSGTSLKQLLGEDAADALEKLNAKLPSELRQSYAMIPISHAGVVGVTGLAAVPNNGLLKTAMNPYMQRAVRGLMAGQLAESVSSTGPTSAEMETPLPEWVYEPGPGRVVIESEFSPDSNPQVLESLGPTLVKAMNQHVKKQLADEFPVGVNWDSLLDVSMTESAMIECIEKTVQRTEYVGSTVQTPMYKTHALVKFPQQLDSQVTDRARAALQQNRTMTIGVTVGATWISVMLLALMTRLGRGSSKALKIVGIPALCLVFLPLSIASGAMIAGMASGEFFDFPMDDARIVCVIDDLEK